MRTSSLHLRSLAIATAGTMTLAVAVPMRAQELPSAEMTLQVTAADNSAALVATTRYRHAQPANNVAGQELRAEQTAEGTLPYGGAGGGSDRGAILRYFGDVTYGGGKVVKSAVSHAIYLQPDSGVQCTIATCWGDPEGFLRDLERSDFIHDVDQYVGVYGGDRYTVGFHATVNYSPQATPLLDTDIQAFVHAVAVKSGASGYGHIYHVFLPPGQDECVDSSFDTCYSPDNPAAFYYCAYHSSVDFPDIGHVIYTFQPYQNVTSCQDQPGTPNGTLVDTADDSLDHELIESITDPDGDAWTNTSASYYSGLEIADECQFFDSLNIYYSEVPAFLIGTHVYAVQTVYSNKQHACSSAP
jgi:hypothetical protein